MNQPSNIRVNSNVFPVATEYVESEREDPVLQKTFPASGACKDPQFRRQIRDRDALRKLARQLGFGRNNEREEMRAMLEAGKVEPWQVFVFIDHILDGGCGCEGVGKTVGIVRRAGRIQVVCRCPNGSRCRLPQDVDFLTPRNNA